MKVGAYERTFIKNRGLRKGTFIKNRGLRTDNLSNFRLFDENPGQIGAAGDKVAIFCENC